MELVYRNWINTHVENNIPHPEYPRHHGGLMDFSEEERQKILNTLTVPRHLCCSDPYWLFRIYQDTIVHPKEAVQLLTEAIQETATNYHVAPFNRVDITPAALGDSVKCQTVFMKGPDHQEGESVHYQIQVLWEKPWNVEKVVKYGIWCHQTFKEYFTEELHSILDVCSAKNEKDEVEIWVRPYYYGMNYTLPTLDTLNLPLIRPQISKEVSPGGEPELMGTLKYSSWSKKLTCSCNPLPRPSE